MDELTRHKLEDSCIAVVVGSEKLAPYGVGVVFSLVKVFDVPADVGSLSFRRLPNNIVDAWTRLWWPWMGPHSDLSTAVCSPDFAKATDDMVTGGLFRLARYVPPLVAWGNPEPIPLSMQLFSIRGKWRCRYGSGGSWSFSLLPRSAVLFCRTNGCFPGRFIFHIGPRRGEGRDAVGHEESQPNFGQ